MIDWSIKHPHWFAFSTSIGIYSIKTIQRGRKYLLTLDERAVGILSDVHEIRRLAETDYLQRTGTSND